MSYITEAPILKFERLDYIRIQIDPILTTHRNDFSLRFKSPLDDGFLFKTTNEINGNNMIVVLQDGRVKITTDIERDTEVRKNSYDMDFIHYGIYF